MNKLTFSFDLDGTLVSTVRMRYSESVPIPERVELVRQLHRAGHRILIQTARGQSMRPDVRAQLMRQTRSQLRTWGIPYHELRQKPFAHFYVDDRGVEAGDFFRDPVGHIEAELAAIMRAAVESATPFNSSDN